MKQPKLETRSKKIIEVDGLKFKDLNNNGKLDPYEDWRLPTEERAKDLVSKMNLDEKTGMMLINSIFMGKLKKEGNSTQILDEEFVPADGTPMRVEDRYPTTKNIKEFNFRHFIARDNSSAENIAEWVNKMNEVAESTRLGIPIIIASNSRNENSDAMIDGDIHEGAFSVYPGTLGIAAAVKGDLANGGDFSLIDEFAQNSRKEWTATGLRKGYMYMADVVTDPRWQRISGTFGEDPEFISEAIAHIIDEFQGEKLNSDSIALTIKHFPGGGARENGFDPHYIEGKWNIYRTEGSLEKYHLPPFVEAAKHNPSSMMPYYSAPNIEKSHYQEFNGKLIPFEEVGMAFNEYILNDLLKEQLNFTGYINSDTGITGNMAWGVQDLSTPAKFAKAVNAGTHLISGTNKASELKKAVENKLIPESKIDDSNIHLLSEMFDLGLFDDKTYVSQKESVRIGNATEPKEKAYQAHLKSVTLLKNDGTLPVKNKNVYIEAFRKDPEKGEKYTKNAVKAAQKLHMTVVYDYKEADVAILFLRPESGDYFSATPGLLELEICENKTNIALNGDSYTETTLSNLNRYYEITDYMQHRNKKVVTSINITLPWILSNIESRSNVLIAGYDTFEKAQLEVLIGNHKPTGKLPITLPKNPQVIAVDEFDKSVSRNDVPGYDKDKYMREGMTYAYQDSANNEYKLDFGLTY